MSDKPVQRSTEDLLGFEDYADALADMIDNAETDTPLTIARCLRRLVHPLPAAMLSTDERRRRGLGMALGSLSVAILLLLLPTFGELLRQSFGPRQATEERLLELLGPAHATVILGLLAAFVLSRHVMGIAQSVSKFIDDPRSEAAKGTMGQISAQLGQLIDQATRAPSRWYQMPERIRTHEEARAVPVRPAEAVRQADHQHAGGAGGAHPSTHRTPGPWQQRVGRLWAELQKTEDAEPDGQFR